MTTLEITYKPTSRIGNGMIAANSFMSADITPKESLWINYGDDDLALIWASQILEQRFKNDPCVVISAKVKVS